ncbi:galactose-1-phosphate uridylyltransferase [Adlercreutzia caecimuris]|uniref:galactose-1-phosphate uridylyltransferase n=1 Tax=Adlercreutzia caecimuris TaxID=671266 RepID=UPI0013730C09|nr:galactose-1-phosphate uridylyltransferase [Adlercreutzia caecimuris]
MSAVENPAWVADSPAGPLEITINLAKPEKDPRTIARAASEGAVCEGSIAEKAGRSSDARGNGAASDAAAASLRADGHGSAPLAVTGDDCVLCWQRAADGSLACAGAGSGDVRSVELAGEEWAWWFSPYGYFPEHLIVSAPAHRPMAITHGTIDRLLDFVDAYPQWFIGSNADLPIVGGSILVHDHFQGGGYRFLLMKRPVRQRFALPGLGGVEASIVDWPASVARLRASDRTALGEAACRLMDAWRTFSFEPCGIRAFSPSGISGGSPGKAPDRAGQRPAAPAAAVVPHNTLNPILWREGDDYVMDLVLRNNRTTPERPYGLFHVPEHLFRIKKENIGLIEIMGRAILPGRLAAELPEVRPVCGAAYYEILQATGVFKDDECGHAGWNAFIAAL